MAEAYKVTSEEGAQRYGAEVGAVVELDLDPNEKLAVVAAGWLERTTDKKKEVK